MLYKSKRTIQIDSDEAFLISLNFKLKRTQIQLHFTKTCCAPVELG